MNGTTSFILLVLFSATLPKGFTGRFDYANTLLSPMKILHSTKISEFIEKHTSKLKTQKSPLNIIAWNLKSSKECMVRATTASRRNR